jgi:hypothetical protein
MTQLNKMMKERRPKANKAYQSKANKFGKGQTQLQRSKGRGLRQSCASGEVLAGVGEGIKKKNNNKKTKKRFFKRFCTEKVKPNLTMKRQAAPNHRKRKGRK